jgi:hypothetical protein
VNKYALVKDGIVTSVIVARPQFIGTNANSTLQEYVIVDVTALEYGPGPGWTYDGSTFTPPEGE